MFLQIEGSRVSGLCHKSEVIHPLAAPDAISLIEILPSAFGQEVCRCC